MHFTAGEGSRERTRISMDICYTQALGANMVRNDGLHYLGSFRQVRKRILLLIENVKVKMKNKSNPVQN